MLKSTYLCQEQFFKGLATNMPHKGPYSNNFYKSQIFSALATSLQSLAGIEPLLP